MTATPDPIAEYYDQKCADEWSRLDRHRTEHALTWKAFEQYLPPAPARILDCGGGPGRYAIELARRGYEVTLFDLSPGNLQLARQKAAENGVRLESFEQGSALDLGRFAGESFDAVLLMGPFYHLLEQSERQRALLEGKRVLKSGETLFASFISRYAAHRDAAFKDPEWLQREPERSAVVLANGRLAPVDGIQAQFIAHFTHPNELPALFWDNGLEIQATLGVEGLVGGVEERVNALEGELWQRWVDLNYQVAADPSIHGLVEHLLLVARKPLWRSVLRRLAGELEHSGLEYKVAGGASLALHGLWLPVKDLDLELSAEAAYRFQQLFGQYAVQPVAFSESPQYRSHFGKFEIGGVKIDVMGDLHRREGDGWAPSWTRTLELIDLDGLPVRVSSLEEEALGNIRRARLERAALCLPKCDPERLARLLRRLEPCGVL
jgi:S-adenosylmethionine-dependent methyltransferase